MFGEALFGRKEEKTAEQGPPQEYAPYKRYVEKQMLPIVVCTNIYRIEGIMHITYHHRALDVLNGPETFVPITQAKIYNAMTGDLIVEREFVAISKRQLVLLYETGEPIAPPERAEIGVPGQALGEAGGQSGGEQAPPSGTSNG